MEGKEDKRLIQFSRDEAGNMTYEPFEANGKKFRFIKPGDPVGIEKWKYYEELKIVVGSGATFSQLINGLKAHKELLAADQPFAEIRAEAIVWADSMMKGLVDLSKSRYDKAFYLCSIFIYRDGTDPYEWSYDIAEEMIKDWAVARVDEQDLFFFAMLLIPAWQGIFKELQGQAERNAARSLVDMLFDRAKSKA